jgi:hypothetical protein
VTHLATANVKHFEGLGFEKVWNPIAEKTNDEMDSRRGAACLAVVS